MILYYGCIHPDWNAWLGEVCVTHFVQCVWMLVMVWLWREGSPLCMLLSFEHIVHIHADLLHNSLNLLLCLFDIVDSQSAACTVFIYICMCSFWESFNSSCTQKLDFNHGICSDCKQAVKTCQLTSMAVAAAAPTPVLAGLPVIKEATDFSKGTKLCFCFSFLF